jgi:hypothetical protein
MTTRTQHRIAEALIVICIAGVLLDLTFGAQAILTLLFAD